MARMHWPILGAVRFFLAVIVAGYHLRWFVPGSEWGLNLGNMSGLAAVLGFLVISGYSIAASYAAEPAGFYYRRLLRIVPLYLVAIAAGAFCTTPFGGSVRTATGALYVAPSFSDILQNLFFLQGFTTQSIATNAVIWSLSIEVLFYLLTPLLSRLSQPALLAVAGGSLGIFLLNPWFDTPFYSVMEHGGAAAALAWFWLAGFIAFRHRDHLSAALILMGVLLLALNMNHRGLALHWSITVGVVPLAMGFGERIRGPGWLAGLLTLLGDASYPLYLIHLPLYIVLAGFGLHLSDLGLLAAAVGLAVLLDRLYDRPVKNLIRARLSARVPVAVAQPQP